MTQLRRMTTADLPAGFAAGIPDPLR